MKPFLAILAAIILVGCATPPDRIAFNTLKSTEIAASDGLKAWAVYAKSVEGTPSRITLDQHLQVKRAYDAYKSSATGATDAIIAGKRLTGKDPDWALVTEDLKAALAELLKTIQAIERK